MTICRICNNKTGNKDSMAREMHVGYREEFAYFECSQCGCLQITEIPDDLSKYPQDYYSYRASGPSVAYGKPRIGGYKIRLIVKILTRHYFHRKNFVGAWVAKKSSVSGDIRVGLDVKGSTYVSLLTPLSWTSVAEMGSSSWILTSKVSRI